MEVSGREQSTKHCLASFNQVYVLAGFPAGYEQEPFYHSDEYRHLQRNLMRYSPNLQRQILARVEP